MIGISKHSPGNVCTKLRKYLGFWRKIVMFVSRHWQYDDPDHSDNNHGVNDTGDHDFGDVDSSSGAND